MLATQAAQRLYVHPACQGQGPITPTEPLFAENHRFMYFSEAR